MNGQSLKMSLTSGTATFGSWITLAHPGIAEIMANAGFDWLVVDMEHSVITIREAEELIRVIDLCGVAPLIRLTSNDVNQIKRVMDAGAHGVVVPMVNTRADAQRAVEAVHYPPRGARGVGLARAQGYGTRFEGYRQWLSDEAVLIVQIEHVKGVENARDILSTPGVDGFIVGPYDLSGSLGVTGVFDHPLMIEALDEVLGVARQLGVTAGYHVVPPTPALVEARLLEGYRFIGYSVDMLFLGCSCREGVKTIRFLGRAEPIDRGIAP